MIDKFAYPLTNEREEYVLSCYYTATLHRKIPPSHDHPNSGLFFNEHGRPVTSNRSKKPQRLSANEAPVLLDSISPPRTFYHWKNRSFPLTLAIFYSLTR
jgi:hypothetical protein